MTIRSFSDPHGTSDEARQFLADRRCERNHPKRHATSGRRKRMSAKKKARLAMEAIRREKSKTRYRIAVKAYWSGESDCHP